MTDTGATFVDLDGTLLIGNSMRIFMKTLPATLWKRRAPGAMAASLWWMGWRSVRIISHRSMKWHLTAIARRHLADEDWEAIAEKMAEDINPVVRDYVASPSRAKCKKYIATAAMEEYVAPLSRILGYDGAVATRFTEEKSDYAETRGSRKRDDIEALLESGRLRLESFLTDHYDDLPTASAFPNLTILVNPTPKMQHLFHNVGVTRYL